MKALLRRGLRAVIALGMRQCARPYALEAGSRCLIIAPHQDDETLGCGRLILTRCAVGLPVNIIYITDGAGSHPGHPQLSPAELARLRRAEAIQAMQLLGLEPNALQFINASDGTLARLSTADFEVFARRLADAIIPLQPTEVFLPCRDDGSSEHAGAFTLTKRALKIAQLDPRLFEYPVWARWSPQRLLRPVCDSHRVLNLSFPLESARKRAALKCYTTQVAPTPPWAQPVLPRGFTQCFDAAEEFYFER